jgi:hypothetical protein
VLAAIRGWPTDGTEPSLEMRQLFAEWCRRPDYHPFMEQEKSVTKASATAKLTLRDVGTSTTSDSPAAGGTPPMCVHLANQAPGSLPTALAALNAGRVVDATGSLRERFSLSAGKREWYTYTLSPRGRAAVLAVLDSGEPELLNSPVVRAMVSALWRGHARASVLREMAWHVLTTCVIVGLVLYGLRPAVDPVVFAMLQVAAIALSSVQLAIETRDAAHGGWVPVELPVPSIASLFRDGGLGGARLRIVVPSYLCDLFNLFDAIVYTGVVVLLGMRSMRIAEQVVDVEVVRVYGSV